MEQSEIKLMPVDEIQRAYDENNMEVITGVATGKIKAQRDVPVVEEQPKEISTEQPTEPTTEDTTPDVSIVQERYNQDIQRAQQYITEMEKKQKESNELQMAEKSAILKQLEEERVKREEVEKRIRELDQQRIETPTSSEEDEDLVSDYAKNTRRMIESLKQEMTHTSVNDSKYTQLEERLRKYEENEAKRIQQEEESRKAKEVEDRIYTDVRKFQSKYPELQTKRDFSEVATDFNQFKSSLASFIKATSPKDVDRALMTYFDEDKGKKLREEAEVNGIKPPEDYDKYVAVAELVDMTRGIEYDPVLERFVQIKNQFGEPVRYRSIEESYKVKNYYNEINSAKKKVANQISKKLTDIQNNPVTIDNNSTAPIGGGMTNEQAGEIIRNAELYVVDKQRYELLKRAYAKIGAPPPQYRGK